MKTIYHSKLLALYLGLWTALMPMRATAEDIDIFTGASAGSSANPNVLIILDNSANWSRQSQQWPPDPVTGLAASQGQAEAGAMQTVLAALASSGKGANVNIGLMEYGSETPFGGYIRSAIKTMTATNESAFSTQLDTIALKASITDPGEKVSANNNYGDLMYDAYNYYAGAAPVTPGVAGVKNSPDAAGYTSGSYAQFASPLSADKSCARNFIIFIGNPASHYPTSDTTANSCALAALSGGTTSCASGKFEPQLGLANFSNVNVPAFTPLGGTAKCYTSTEQTNFNIALANCVAAGNPGCYSSTVDANYVTATSTSNSSQGTAATKTVPGTGCAPYTNDCNLGSAVSGPTSEPMACPVVGGVQTQSYHVLQTTSVAQPSTTTTPVVTTSSTGGTYSTTTGITCVTDTATGHDQICSFSSPTTACYTSKPGVTAVVVAGVTTSSLATATPLNCPQETINYATLADGTQVKTDTTHACTYAVSSTPAAACPGIPVTPPAPVNTTSCYPGTGNAQSAADTGTLTCAAGYTCSYAWNTPATACPTTPTNTNGITTACYGSSTDASTAITAATSPDHGGLTCPTLPLDAFGNPPACSYALRTTGTPAVPVACSAYVQTATTSCLAAAPAANAATALSYSLAACPTNSTCTYTVASPTDCSVTDPAGVTTGYYSVAQASTLTFPNNVNNTASPATETGTNLSCPANTTCSYTVGAFSAKLGDSSGSGVTTNVYASSTTASAAITAGTDIGGMTCPANYTCTYAVGTANSTPTATTTTYNTTGYYSSTPAITSPATSSSLATTTTLTCPANNTCTYSVGAANTAVSSGAGVSNAANKTNECLTASPPDYVYDNNSGSNVTIPGASASSTPPWYADINNGYTNLTGFSFTCKADQHCVISSSGSGNACAASSGHLAGTNYAMNFTQTGMSTYPVTQTATPWVKYKISQTQTGMSTYTVTQKQLKNTYTVTQSEAKNKYGLTQASGPASTNKYTVTQSLTQDNYTYTVTQTDTPTIKVTTTPPNVMTTSDLGASPQCYASIPSSYPGTGGTYPESATYSGAGNDFASACGGGVQMWVSGTTYSVGDIRQSPANSQTYTRLSAGAGTTDPSLDAANWTFSSSVVCTYVATGTAATTNQCPSGTNQYVVQGYNVSQTTGPSGTFTTDTAVLNADEWAKMLFQKGVPVSGGSNATVSTYTIDVYNASRNTDFSGLYMSMAKNGGGKYYTASNKDQIAAALNSILAEIQSVNSTFASASLPVNSTNRAQNANQVFIGMFRPDKDAAPRWFGNLKQYQIGSNGITLDLYDNSTPSKPAINSQTGFLDDCARSFWTTDSPTPNTSAFPWLSSYYWGNVTSDQAVTKCTTTVATSISTANPDLLYSDLPDGSFVEKGAVAEVLRKGNDPANSTPSWSFLRDMYTLDGSGTLVAYDLGSSGLTADPFNFTQGKDVNNDNGLSTWTSSTNIMRPSVHGDVVHSRPLPINYGTSANANAGVTAYYGSNDGTFRAVVASGTEAGKELWAFVAPEFSNKLSSRNPTASTDPLTRLMNNSPLVSYPTTNLAQSPTPIPKDYFFDGSTGVYQNIDNTKVWIYPSMRRGGRMMYSFDVANSNPSAITTPPFAFKWRAGCPDLSDDNGCTAGMSGIGQTWSTPSPAFLDGYSLTDPVVIVGGGYDECEDADTSAPPCGGGKGHHVYVLDANTGAVIKSFATAGSVIADVAFIDPDNDSYVDYGYVVDTRGNVYRINFTDPANGNAPLSSAQWTIQRIAYTTGGGRKFQWAPGLLPNNGKVYIAFASGDREHPLITNYPYTTPVTNRLYVYLDDMATTDTNLDGSTMSNFSADQTCSTVGIGLAGNSNNGWYMDFPGTGEQAVTSAVIAGGMVTVSTNRPIPPTSGTCSTALGEARGYWVNLFNAAGAMGVTGSCGGTRSGTFVGGGLPPSPVFGTVPIDGVPTTVLIGAIQREGGASSPIAPQKLRPTIPSTRKMHYWKHSGDN